MALNDEPYTSREVVDLLWLWSRELGDVANDTFVGDETSETLPASKEITKIKRLKLRRVSREINELLERLEAENV